MNQTTNVRLRTETNGALTIENDDGTITIQPDGTVAISTRAPIQLTGESLGKLDRADGLNVRSTVLEALLKRGTKR